MWGQGGLRGQRAQRRQGHRKERAREREAGEVKREKNGANESWKKDEREQSAHEKERTGQRGYVFLITLTRGFPEISTAPSVCPNEPCSQQGP